MTERAVVHALDVPGARLYYERRGTGPPLLLIPGGDGRSANFATVADMLAWDYTVLTYDRRGHARSRLLPGTDPALSMERQSADARAVIERAGFGSAAVLGVSAGALIGLDLAARFPHVVDVLVAHEPPLISMLPEAPRLRADRDAVQRTLERHGPHAAVIQYMGQRGILPGSRLKRAALRLALVRRTGFAADMAFMVTHERSFSQYEPDTGTLAAGGVPVILAGGHESKHLEYYRAAQKLAERLGAGFEEFPGAHAGFMTHPGAFAGRLTEILAAALPAQKNADAAR